MPEDIKRRLGRRLLVVQVAGAATAASVLSNEAEAKTGLTDNDPSDGPGNGRGGRRGTGITDNDPSDGPGNGRGNRGTGITDSDPSDGPGNGRGNRKR